MGEEKELKESKIKIENIKQVQENRKKNRKEILENKLKEEENKLKSKLKREKLQQEKWIRLPKTKNNCEKAKEGNGKII